MGWCQPPDNRLENQECIQNCVSIECTTWQNLELKTNKKNFEVKGNYKAIESCVLLTNMLSQAMLLPPEQAAIATPTIASCREALRPKPNNQPWDWRQAGASAMTVAALLTV